MKKTIMFGLATTVLFLMTGCQSNLEEAENGYIIDGKLHVAVENIEEGQKVKLQEGEMVVYGQNTWIPEPGNPVELMILTDKTCGEACDTTQGTQFFRERLTRALIINTVDVSSDLGKELASDFDVLGVPAFILGQGIESLERFGANVLDQLKPIVTEQGGRYLVDGKSIGVKVGKFLKDIEFADLGSEPKKGKGKVRVVEFTDYQCPYCKRLNDNTKDLISQYIDDGTIEYVIKDFPLSFHTEANAMHAAANCAMKQDKDKYWAVKDFIFENQQAFGGRGDEGARTFLLGKAEEWGLDKTAMETCMTSQETKDEIAADIAEGAQWGVSGTPALYVGNEFVPGAIGADKLKELVESQLAK